MARLHPFKVTNSDSDESDQNSEPSSAVDTLDPTQMIVRPFGNGSSNGASAEFSSRDGGSLAQDGPFLPTGCSAPMSVASSTPFVPVTWAGETQAGNLNPPDCNIAAGTGSVITCVNTHIDIYTKSGANLLSQTLTTFFNLPGNFLFDSRVTWDQYAGRFIVLSDDVTGTSSLLHVAVSKDSNPLDGWFFKDINTKVGNSFLEYPQLAIDSTNIYITGNMHDLSNGSYTGSRLFSFDKNTLESGVTNGAVSSFDTFSDVGPTDFNDLYTTAHTYGSTAGLQGTFLVNYHQINGGNDTVDIVRVDSSGGAPMFFGTGGTGLGSAHNVGDISDAALAGAHQPNTSVTIDDTAPHPHLGDHEIQNAVWQNNILYAVTAIRVDSGISAHDVVHWFRFDTSNVNNVTLLNQGNIDYGPFTDTYYGDLAVDNNGNMIIGFSFSNSFSAYASSAYITIAPDGSHDSGLHLTEGQGVNTTRRWGDYSGMAIDPLNRRSFWVFNQYATASNSWATTVGGGFQAAPITGFQSQAFQLAGFAPNAGGWSSQNTYPRELADVNGDGMADIVGFGQAGVYVSRATGGGHFAAPTFELGNFGTNAGGWSSDDLYPRELADVNVDGKADIVGFGYDGVYVSRATGDGHFTGPTFELGNFGIGAGGWGSQNTYPRELADVNGDGMADIVGFSSVGVYVSRATAGGHFTDSTFELNAFGPGGGWTSDDLYPRELADIEGNGMADIVGFGYDGVYVSRATGDGHFTGPTFELGNFGIGAGGWGSQNTYPRELVDVNGDGRADIVGFADSGVYVSLATGSGHFAAPSFKLAAFGPSAGGWSSNDTYPREVADITGDGMADIVGFSSVGVYTSISAVSASMMAAADGSPSTTMTGGANDELQLDPLSSFSGTVAGMSGQDTLNLTDTSFPTVQTPMSSASSSGATTPVADSTPSANIALLGNSLASTFVPSSDGQGGASIVASQAGDIGQNTLLTQPQHT
jgi:hypothetical protein